ncbi:MAG: hypothetical protein WD096_10665 [Actinomycetota bacterium]
MRQRIAWTAATAILLFAAACTSAITTEPSQTSVTPTPASPTTTPGEAELLTAEDFDPSRFDPATSAVIDHAWFPLTPGTQAIYEGSTLEDGERLARRVVITVTDFTKVIGGVRALVTWDLDYAGDELVEAELAFYAQDTDGYVWRMGEYPEEYEGGEFVKAPGWFHGLAGATAGIHMMAEPTAGTPSYAQGFAPPPVDWNDRGRVYATGRSTCVLLDCYDDVVIIEEFERGKPHAFQLKFYAPGVGNVRVGWRGVNEEEREVLQLVSFEHLTGAEMVDARNEALALEAHGSQIKASLFGELPPLEPL